MTQHPFIPLDEPLLGGNERKYLNQCIDTNWISWQGEFGGRLEKAMAGYCETKHALAIVNGTYALVLALQALGVGPDDEVICPTLTMSATAFAATTVGAKVVWVDNAPHSLTLDPADVARKITAKTKAVLAVHLYGRAADMERLLAVTKPKNIPVIEDVAEGFAAKTSGRRVGGWGTIACHSFHNKILASGEGGAVTLNDDRLAAKLNELRTPPPDNAGGTVIALNNRMSNLAAAVALAQLERVDELVETRRKVAKLYDQYFAGVPGLETFKERDNEWCVFWRYQIALTPGHPLTNKELVARLRKHNIESRPIFTLMSDHPYYKPLSSGEYPNARLVSEQSLDLPSSPRLTPEQIERVAKTVIECVANKR
ncbi:MAG: DegT/DnrJ/EryC1/StrS family aminotransferase [Deltaproteobacteria bacterium]|nr:DegT/DnrJ/EryC1/StrS family aminotransferase [Deltaproteobacteria bacterium]